MSRKIDAVILSTPEPVAKYIAPPSDATLPLKMHELNSVEASVTEEIKMPPPSRALFDSNDEPFNSMF